MDYKSNADLYESYGRVAPLALRSVLRFVLAAREQTGGDLDLWVVLSVIASRNMETPEFRSATVEGLRAPPESMFGLRPTNIRSIAASTGIPKETVRRKVLELVKRGWVTRVEDGLVATAKGASDNVELAKMLMDLVDDLRQSARAGV